MRDFEVAVAGDGVIVTDQPQPIRADNFSTTMFNPSKEWSPVKAR